MSGSDAAPFGLRLVHAAVFSALGLLVVRASRPEWEQLHQMVTRPFIIGAPPQPGLLLAGVAAALSVLTLWIFLIRGRSAPTALSVAIGVSLAWSMLVAAPEETRVSPARVNLELLEATRGVQHRLGSELQREGEVASEEAFRSALAETRAPRHVELRDNRGRPMDIRLRSVPSMDAEVEPIPGEVWLWRSPGGGAFALRAVGIDATGHPHPLTDDRGEALWLEAVYQPSELSIP